MYFLRHGQSEFNAAMHQTGRDPGIVDAPLTARGRAEAEAAAHKLKPLGFTRLISSPYTRALQTAESVGGILGLPIIVEPLTGERAIYTCDIGQPRSVLQQSWPQADFSLLSDEHWWPAMPEGQENLEQRAQAFKTRYSDQAEVATTLVVAHWYFIYAVTGCDLRNCEFVEIVADSTEIFLRNRV